MGKMDRCHYSDLRLLLAMLCLVAVSVQPVHAQESGVGMLPRESERINSFSLSAGDLGVLDEYLSPNVYNGPVLGLVGHRTHLLKRDSSWMYSSFLKLGCSSLTGQSGIDNFQSLMLDCRLSWEKIWVNTSDFSLSAGPEAFLKFGGLYNSRNTNNPAQMKLYVAAGIAGEASYRFKIKNYPIALGWRANLPLIGYNFAPTYALQYYEIYYFDRFGEASHFAWPGNVFAFSHQVSLSLPVGKVQLRLSYMGDYYRYNIDGLRCRMYENSCLVGIVKRIEIKYNGR